MTPTYVADDGELSNKFEDREPDSDVAAAFGGRPASLASELVSVESYLQPVVEQREQRRQRKRRHEYRYEAELQDYNAKKHCSKVK